MVTPETPAQGESDAARSQGAPRRKRPFWLFIRICILMAGGVSVVMILLYSTSERSLVYNSRPLEAWFYGSNGTFFLTSTRAEAQTTITGLGTNAIPFLIATLKNNRGNSSFYFKAYGFAPKWLQTRLSSPVSKDDIRSAALGHLLQMRGLAPEQVQLLADRVAVLENPRLRMSGFFVMVLEHQTDPAFLPFCRRLLGDSDPGIRLEAAMYVANSAIQADPREPRLFPILLAGLNDKELRISAADLRIYSWQQQPPGTTPAGMASRRVSSTAAQAEFLQNEVKRALHRLERYLTPEQKSLFRQSLERQKDSSEKVVNMR